jgi:hypothetical protein
MRCVFLVQVSQKGALMVKLQLAAKCASASDQEERKADAETKAKVAAAGGAPVAESKGDSKTSVAETKGDSKQVRAVLVANDQRARIPDCVLLCCSVRPACCPR